MKKGDCVKADTSNFCLVLFRFLFHDFAATALRYLSRCLSLSLKHSQRNSVVSVKCFGVN